MDAQDTGPIVLPLPSGLVRPIQLLGAERTPAALGFLFDFWLVMTAIYGQWDALYGLVFGAAWHGYWMLAFKRDPQYAQIVWKHWVTFPWPEELAAWPGIGAKRVKVEPSVAVQG